MTQKIDRATSLIDLANKILTAILIALALWHQPGHGRLSNNLQDAQGAGSQHELCSAQPGPGNGELGVQSVHASTLAGRG